MSKARLNNKQEKRKIIMHQSISSSQWEQYRNMIDTTILTVPKFSINSTMNVKWHNLKQLIRAAADSYFPTKYVSNKHREKLPPYLATMKYHLAYLSSSHSLFSIHTINNSPHKITQNWSEHYRRIHDIVKLYNLPIPEPPITRYLAPHNTLSDTILLLRTIKSHISTINLLLSSRL